MIANSKWSGNIHIEDNSIDADFSKLSENGYRSIKMNPEYKQPEINEEEEIEEEK